MRAEERERGPPGYWGRIFQTQGSASVKTLLNTRTMEASIAGAVAGWGGVGGGDLREVPGDEPYRAQQTLPPALREMMPWSTGATRVCCSSRAQAAGCCTEETLKRCWGRAGRAGQHGQIPSGEA